MWISALEFDLWAHRHCFPYPLNQRRPFVTWTFNCQFLCMKYGMPHKAAVKCSDFAFRIHFTIFHAYAYVLCAIVMGFGNRILLTDVARKNTSWSAISSMRMIMNRMNVMEHFLIHSYICATQNRNICAIYLMRHSK